MALIATEPLNSTSAGSIQVAVLHFPFAFHFPSFRRVTSKMVIQTMQTKSGLRLFVVRSLLLLLCLVAGAGLSVAQSPNTATIVVVVVDQNDAVMPGAKVSVANNSTGAVREAVSDDHGSVTASGLSLTGTYTVTVSKEGFGNEERKDITLRSAEIATVKVKLLIGAEKAEVTIFGTAEGVRADPQIGRVLDSPQIDETPILGRKVSSLPLLNSAFRQGKGTGDLFVNQTYFITDFGSRRAQAVPLDGAKTGKG